MKRFLISTVLIAATLGVMLYFVPKPMQDDISRYAQYDATVNVYCRKTTSDCIDLGLGYQVTCAVADFRSVLTTCKNVDGVSVTFAGTFDDVKATVARLRATEVSRQRLDGLYVACYYSPLIRDRALIDGKTVNVQIAYRDGVVTVGYPLILGSY